MLDASVTPPIAACTPPTKQRTGQVTGLRQSVSGEMDLADRAERRSGVARNRRRIR
jgi:hypothetical protein